MMMKRLPAPRFADFLETWLAAPFTKDKSQVTMLTAWVSPEYEGMKVNCLRVEIWHRCCHMGVKPADKFMIHESASDTFCYITMITLNFDQVCIHFMKKHECDKILVEENIYKSVL